MLNVGDEQREWVAHLIREMRLPAELQRGSSGHEQTRLLPHQESAIGRTQLGQLRVHTHLNMRDKKLLNSIAFLKYSASVLAMNCNDIRDASICPFLMDVAIRCLY